MSRTTFPLPETPDPGVYRSLCIRIPDEPAHRQAFLGALLNLAKWYSWGRDDAHTGAAAAAVWQQIYYEASAALAAGEGCDAMPFDVRQNPDAACELQKSTTGGISWTTWANLQLCPPRLARTPGGNVLWYNPDTEQWEAVEQVEDYDPRDYPINKPVAAGKCVAASNAAMVLRALFDSIFQANFFSAVNATAAAGMMATGITMLIGVSVTAGLLIPIAVLILGALTSTLIGRFTSTVENRVRCIVSGHLASDGTLAIPADSYNAILTEIFTESGTDIAYLGVWYLLQAVGEAGLAAALAIDAGGENDCCGTWCMEWTGVALGAWLENFGGEGDFDGSVWNSTLYNGTFHAVFIKIPVPEGTIITSMGVGYDAAEAPPLAGTLAIRPNNGTGARIYTWYNAAMPRGQDKSVTGSGTYTVAAAAAAIVEMTQTGTAGFRIERIVMRGIGQNPFGVNNCT